MRPSRRSGGPCWRSWRFLLGAAAICMADLLGVRGSAAAETRYEVYLPLPPVAVEKLQQMRGGLILAGLDIGFGATVRVLADSTLVAETVLTMLEDGSFSESTTIADGFGAQPFSHDDAFGVDLSGLPDARGIAIKDAAGETFALFDIALDHTKSVLINTAADRDIQQLVDVTLEIRNFDAVQSKLLQGAALQNLARVAMPDALTGLRN